MASGSPKNTEHRGCCGLKYKMGSYPLLVKRVPRRRGGLRVGHTFTLTSWGEHEATAQEIEVCPAKHLTLEHLEAIDMALNRPIGPRAVSRPL